MHTAARAWVRYLLAMGVAVVALSLLLQLVQGTSYAGASDDTAVRTGLALYGPYVRRVAALIAVLLVLQVLQLSVLSAGLLVFLHERIGSGGRAFARLLPLAATLAVCATGAEAYRYPGLFLPLASSGWAGVAWVEAGHAIWLLAMVASAAGFAWTAYRSRGLRGRVGPAAASAVVLLALSSPSPRPSPNPSPRAPSPPPQLPNILLVGVDSLRPDAIDPQRTPTLARLVRGSVYFPNALVTLPRTGPSWTALLTSLPPLENGVETMFPHAQRSDLSKQAMPSHLGSLGFRTGVFSEYAGEFFARVQLGFDTVAVPQVELKQMLGQAILARFPAALALAAQLYTASPAVRRRLPAPLPELLRGTASFAHPKVLEDDLAAWIEADKAAAPPTAAAHPWFALVFFSQPHFPYTSSSTFLRDRGGVAGSDPALRYGKDAVRGAVRTPEDQAQVEQLYRSALAETDTALASLLERLDAMHELSDTIVVLTADHGEALYECPRCVGHGDNLAGLTSVRVPLAFRLPSSRYAPRPATIATFVSQLDVYPTLLALLGERVPPTHEGLALLDRAGGITAAASPGALRTFFVETGEWLWPSPAVPHDRLEYPPITQMASLDGDRVVISERFLPAVRAAKHRAAIAPPFALYYEPRRSQAVYRLSKIDEDPFGDDDVSERYPERAAELRESLRRSVLRFSSMLEVDGYFLTRPAPPPEEYW